MNTELPSKYDPSSVEAQAYQVWLDEKCFHADPGAPGESFCIVIPPPNVTGALHLGHAMNNTLQDILTRQHRMAGFNALWVPGIDHAGIATQAVVEKQLKEQENKTRHDVGREGLVARIWKWKEQYGDRILEQLKRLGCSCDWDRTRFTLDEMCARAVRETFFKLFKDGLIYRGKRLVNWDTFLQTSISDDEIYHETVKTSLWHIRYPISSTGFQPVSGSAQSSEVAARDSTLRHGQDAHATVYMTVATTRPETMLGDTAVAVHSDDPRWNWAIGKHVRLPLTNRLIPIIADNILVDPKFGTGVVKVTPAHDPNDYAVWQRHKGQPDEIDLINILTPDGKITSDRPEWSKYAGMKRAAARTQVVEDLKAAGLLEKEEPYETQVGHSDRSKTPVEPYLSDQWFVKMAPLAEPALEVVREGKIKFYPERHAQQYLSWLGEKRDWPVSRQLWWGHRIPVWTMRCRSENGYIYNEDAAAAACALQTKPEDAAVVLKKDDGYSFHVELWREDIDLPQDFAEYTGELTIHVALRRNEPAVIEALEKSGFIQDPDVLDTWFSSALWPHSTLGWPEKTPELAKYYPTSVLLTGRDIITLWVARMVMMGMYNMGPQSGTGGPPVSSSAEQQDHGRGARATNAPAPSPLYSGERAGVRSGSSNTSASQSPSTPGPSPQPSPLSTGAREPEARRLGIPFLDVAINPTILDGKGERMSKSKGNGVDPVDIIHSHGADALRFTLTNMATETQDARMPVQVVCPHCGERLPNPDSKDPEMACAKCKKKLTRPMNNATGSDEAPLARMTSDRFDLGRNFCNKLWNACRFALANLENVRAEESAAAQGFEPIALGKTSDEDLMQLTQQGDKKAFSLLYERYSASVLSYLYRILGKVEDVETIGQEVFLRVFRFASTYQYPHKFSTWLFTITRNLATRQSQRPRSLIRRLAELNFERIDMTGKPEEIAARVTDDPEKREEIARVLKALDELPPDQKEVITLGVFQDLTYEEMQEITGVKVDTLQSSMYHGLKRLADSLGSDTASSLSISPSLHPSVSPSHHSLADRWIITRFHRTVAECDEALKSYRFDVYAKSCYDFFWRDFCDWYVEAIKPAMKDPARASETADVLAAVLDGSLRLMHPMIPFITETVWWRLNDVRPQRGLGELLPCPPSKRLVLAQWPTSPRFSPGGHAGSAPHDPAKPPGLNEALIADADDAAIIFPKLQEIISSIRTIRNDYQVNPKQTVAVSIKPPADFAGQIESNRELIELLAVCTLKTVQSDLAPLANAVTSSAAGCDIFVEGLIDPNAERLRLAKDIEAKKKSVEALKTRLGSASYVAKAPPHLVQQTRDQLAAAEAEVVKMEESLRKLG